MIEQEQDALYNAHEELKDFSPELSDQLLRMWEEQVKENMRNTPDGFEYTEVRAKELKEGMEIINIGVVERVTVDKLHIHIHLKSSVLNLDDNKVTVTVMKRLKVRVNH